MRILITRAGINIVDLKTYNCQELGLAKMLSKKGHKVYITTPDYEEKHFSVPVEGGEPVEVYQLKLIINNRIICWHKHLEQTLNIINPDIIHLNGFKTTVCLYFTLWAKRHSRRIVMVEGNYENSSKPFFKQIQILVCKTLGRYVLNHVDDYGCKTLWAGEYVKRFKNVEVKHTPIGLDVDKFLLPEKIDWRNKLGLCNKKILLYIGVQEPRRNPIFLIDVICHLPEDYVLLLVGTGPLVDDVNKKIMNLNLFKRVFQLGKLPQSQLPSLYKTSDLFLLASSYEIYGMVLLESMYFGLPVVSSLTAGSYSLIDNERDGLIINNFDAKIWAQSILALCENSLVLETMKKSARNKIENELVWEKAVDNFINLYQV